MATKRNKDATTVLLAEENVIIRLGLAEHLRSCGLLVLEASTSQEAKAILQAGPNIDVLFSDAQLAGPESGFALAQWVRRHRPGVKVMLQVSLPSKTHAVYELCCPPGGGESHTLTARIQAMLAERKRRARPASTQTPARRRRLH